MTTDRVTIDFVTIDYDAALAAESDRFLEALLSAPSQARVPACPDWDADDLLWHLGGVQHFWANVIRIRPAPPEDYERPERPVDRDGLASFFRAASADLRARLAAADDDQAAWTWNASHQTVAFVRRRQAQEALIHRLDAEQTAGNVTDLPPDLAADGVSEVLDWCLGHTPAWATFTPDEVVVRFESSDSGAVTDVVLGRHTGTNPDDGTVVDEDGLHVLGEAGRVPAATVRGRGADLDTWLWHRGDDTAPSLEGLTLEGDPVVLARLLAVLAEPID